MHSDQDRAQDPPNSAPGRPVRHRERSADGATPLRLAQASAAHDPRKREIIEFAKVWAPYGGGPDEDIFVTFGLTPQEYFTRLAALLATVPTGELSPSQLRTIRTLCAARLRATENLAPIRPAASG
jgi:hypothetical protein